MNVLYFKRPILNRILLFFFHLRTTKSPTQGPSLVGNIKLLLINYKMWYLLMIRNLSHTFKLNYKPIYWWIKPFILKLTNYHFIIIVSLGDLDNHRICRFGREFTLSLCVFRLAERKFLKKQPNIYNSWDVKTTPTSKTLTTSNGKTPCWKHRVSTLSRYHWHYSLVPKRTCGRV